MMLSRAYFGTQDFMVNRALGIFAWIVPLGFRLILAPVMIGSGWYKFENQAQTLQWFSAMNIPEPSIMLQLVIWSEIVGGLLLLIGFATRWVTIPLMIVMAVAALKVHSQHGWYEVLPAEAMRSPTRVFYEMGIPQAKRSMQNIEEGNIRLKRAQVILRDNTDYQWLTAKGALVVKQSGVEKTATYFLMLFSLLFTGAGFFSIDWIINRRKRKQVDDWRQGKAYEASLRAASNPAAMAAAGGGALSHADRVRIARERAAAEQAGLDADADDYDDEFYSEDEYDHEYGGEYEDDYEDGADEPRK